SWGRRETSWRPPPASTVTRPLVYVRTCVWPLLLDQCCDPAFPVVPGAPWGACRGCPIWPTETILPSPAVTRRPPGAKFLYRDAQLLRRSLSLRVILAILIVASRQIRKYCPPPIRRAVLVLSSPAQIRRT